MIKFVHFIKLLTIFLLINQIVFSQDYRLPWTTGATFNCTQGNLGGLSHQSGSHDAYAWDFGMPIGTNIVASRGGVVKHSVGSYSNGNCPWPCDGCSNYVNRITIEHSDGTYALYLHLSSVAVSVGQTVQQGDYIGKSGNTGCSTGPHLHFQVMNNSNGSWWQPSIPISFCDVAGNGKPVAGTSYTSGGNCQSTPPADITPPTTNFTVSNTWKTGNFEINFTDTDESGGSGIWKSLYSPQSYNGTSWEANRNNGFIMEEFSESSLGSNWSSQMGSWSISNGVLKQTDESVGVANISTTNNHSLSNMYIYHWKGKVTGSDVNRRAGIHFFASDPSLGNGGNSYLVYFRFSGNTDPGNNNKVQIYKSTNNVLDLKKNESFTINPDIEYDFKVAYDRIFGQIYVWVNNELAASWQDSSPLAGGDHIIFRSGNCMYEVDDFNVYRSRYPDVTISVGEGSSTNIFYQNFNPQTPSGRVKSIVLDNAGNVSQVVTRTFNVDWTEPVIEWVNDGLETDVDTTYSSTLQANWSIPIDPHSGIVDYQIALGTSPLATDILDWTNLQEAENSYSFSLDNPVEEQIYYYSIYAKNGAGFESWFSSDGQMYLSEEPDNDDSTGTPSEEEDDDLSSGIASETIENVVIYPNPTEDKLFFDGIHEETTVEIIDLQGRLVKTTQISKNNNSISLKELVGGLYILKFEHEDKKIEKKILKR